MKKQQAIGPDGVSRTPGQEQRINEAFFHTFKGEAAEYTLNYLRSITISAVHGPGATDGELRHKEGMRDLMRIINTRIELGELYSRQQVEN
jgi:hypothetical protein